MLYHAPRPHAVVGVFRGKGASNRRAVARILSIRDELTLGDIVRERLREEKSSWSRQEYNHLLSVFFRLVEGRAREGVRSGGLLSKGYVRRVGVRRIKGNEIPTYGLTLKGFLAVIGDRQDTAGDDHLLKTIRRAGRAENSEEFYYFRLIVTLMESGLRFDLIKKLFVSAVWETIPLLNLEDADEDFVMEILILVTSRKLMKMTEDPEYREQMTKLRRGLAYMLEATPFNSHRRSELAELYKPVSLLQPDGRHSRPL